MISYTVSTYGKRIKDLRKVEKLTQKELADALEISSTTITRYEKGDIYPSEPIIIKTAMLFNCSSDYLLGLSSYKKNPKELIKDYEKLKIKEEQIMKVIDELEKLKKLLE